MINNSRAIVFRSVDFSESSRIITLFTRQHGKIAVMARGVRKPKSRLSGILELGNLLEVVYYFKPTRSVQYIKEASMAGPTPAINNRFEKLALITPSIELISQLLQDGEVNEELFDFTWRFISWVNESETTPPALFPYVQVRLAELMGLQMQAEGEPDQIMYLNLEDGILSPEAHAHYSYKLTDAQKKFLLMALQSQSTAVLQTSMDRAELKELIRHLDGYLKFHLEGIRDRKSDAIFEQML